MTIIRRFSQFVTASAGIALRGNPAYWAWLVFLGVLIVSGALAYARQASEGLVLTAMRDLRAVGVDLLTIGQYLRPSAAHLPVARFYTPDEFAELRRVGLQMGYRHVESGPLVRSSYHAWEQAERAMAPA